MSLQTKERQLFRTLSFAGPIAVNELAVRAGRTPDDPEWINLGQGQPEIGEIPGAPSRSGEQAIRFLHEDNEYGPIEGLYELRERVAEHYNRLYRVGKPSRYTAENVIVAQGGRGMLSRVAAAIGAARVGYCTPDYTVYGELFEAFTRAHPVGIAVDGQAGFRLGIEDFEEAVVEGALDGFLFSNPCNPTGVTVSGEALGARLRVARTHGCTLVIDEFYSHYNYVVDAPVSAASHVEDVDEDPVVVIDGLTKCFRYPGWRVAWALAPKAVVRTLAAAGAFVDGGASRPIQRAAIGVLEPARADQETAALRARFKKKRDTTVQRLRAMGIAVPAEPDGSFYCFGSVQNLPEAINTGDAFMREALKQKVLTVPGNSFDVRPGEDRGMPSALDCYLRFSFGPPPEVVEAGLARLAAIVQSFR